MKPDEMKLPEPGAADYKSMMIDLSYETDPPEFQRILPRDQWAVFAHKTYVFQAKKASLQAELFSAQAEMLNAKAEIFLKSQR